MSATNFTPISLYYSATAASVPTAGNLVAGELALNTADGKLFYKDSAGVVQVLATKGGVGSSSNTQVLYNSSGLVVGSANFTYSGSTLTVAGTINAAYVSGTSNLLIRNLSGVNRIDSYNDPITANYPLQILGSPITLYTADTERMRIDSSGNVIAGGTSTYGARLGVIGTASGSNNYIQITNPGIGTGTIGLTASSGNFKLYNSYASGTLTSGSGIDIDTSGNVGIGTSSPGFKLDVAAAQGIVRNTSSTGTNAVDYRVVNTGGTTYFGRDDSTGSSFGSSAYATVLYSSGAYPMAFFTNATESMRIDSSGNLLVGTTSGSTKLRVAGSAVAGRLVSFTPNTAGDVAQACLLVSKYDNNSTTSQVYIQFSMNNDGTASGQINANGASQAAFGSWSDSRLKENIVDLPSQLNNILALRPTEFDYIESEGGGHQIGFIAQEMQEIYPDAVGERADGMLTITGWDKTTARLVKAIQEQQAMIESLTTRLTALESK